MAIRRIYSLATQIQHWDSEPVKFCCDSSTSTRVAISSCSQKSHLLLCPIYAKLQTKCFTRLEDEGEELEWTQRQKKAPTEKRYFLCLRCLYIKYILQPFTINSYAESVVEESWTKRDNLICNFEFGKSSNSLTTSTLSCLHHSSMKAHTCHSHDVFCNSAQPALIVFELAKQQNSQQDKNDNSERREESDIRRQNKEQANVMFCPL